jgi:hypothetical protein
MSVITASAVAEIVETPAPAYCTSLVCVCGNNCHDDPNYHLTFTTWDGAYPQLQEGVSDDAYVVALEMLGG